MRKPWKNGQTAAFGWRRILLAALSLTLLAGGAARAQVTAAATDSAATAAALAAASRAYAGALGTGTALYSGPEYVDYTPLGTQGHQYFLSAEAQPGAVDYRGGHYAGVVLRYDIVRDQPVLPYPGQAVAIMLPVEKVQGFALGERRFVRVVGDTLNKESLATGFYELLVDGPTRLLARHSKHLNQVLIGQVLTPQYSQNDELFLQTGTGAVPVTNLRRLVEVLPNHQSEVQHYARQHKLKFKADERAASAAQALRYYYSLRP